MQRNELYSALYAERYGTPAELQREIEGRDQRDYERERDRLLAKQVMENERERVTEVQRAWRRR